MDRILHSHLARIYGQALDKLCEPKRQPRQSRITVDGEFLSFIPDGKKEVGLYIAADSLNSHQNYFEIEITDVDAKGDVTLGLVSSFHPLDKFPGWYQDSVGFHSKNGKIYKGVPKESLVGPVCAAGDYMGCGIRFENASYVSAGQIVVVFFTKNGKEVSSTEFTLPEDGLYPAVCFFLVAAEVRLTLGMRWSSEDDVLMCIDSNEEEWARLHDIKLNGMEIGKVVIPTHFCYARKYVLEYSGRGKSIIDVGLAQAKYPLDTTHHYFEIEIIDPGENCYIAIGLARKDYPKYRHPGWNKGSIAYHADDGKIFVGSGVGEPFGPPCHKGDKMGCGIIFPRDYVSFSDGDVIHELSSPNFDEDFSGSVSESDEEEWFQEKENTETGAIVQVFFTRNRKTVGQKDVCIPKGGFYPTVGMLSSNEKVKVDLHPLTG